MRVSLPGLVVFGVLLGGCADAASTVRIDVVGDTTRVRIPDAGMEATVATVDILWRDDRLERPTHVVRLGNRLVVADRARVHVVTAEGTHIATEGRGGEGPTEFGYIGGLGRVGDAVVAVDVGNGRYVWLNDDGLVVSTRPRTRDPRYINPDLAEPSAFGSWGDGILERLDTNLGIDGMEGGMPTAVVWSSLADDSSAVVRRWDGVPWIQTSYFVGRASAYSARNLVAVGDSGWVAWSDGLEPCVLLLRVDRPEVVRSCRERSRREVTAEMRRVTPDLVDPASDRADAVLELARAQSMPELVPSLDALRFGDDGRVWARVLGEDAPEIHPVLANEVGDDAFPPSRLWEAVDLEGRPAGRVRLPRAFAARLFTEDRVYGFLELPSGELTLAQAILP